MAFPDFQPTYPDQTVSKTLRTFAVVTAAAGLFATIGPVTGSRDVAFARTNMPVPMARTLLYQSMAYVEAAPFPEAPQLKWFSPLSEPYKFKRALPTHEHQALFFVKASPFPETTDPGKWFEPLSEPYKFKRSLPTHEQQSLAFVKATPFAETVSVDRWLRPLNEPTRRIQRLEGGQAPFVGPQSATIGTGDVLFNSSASSVLFSRATVYQTHFAPVAFTEAITPDKWFEPLSEPVRTRKLTTAAQQSAALVEASPFVETVTADRWLRPLNEPVRRKPVQIYGQSSGFISPDLVAVSTWLMALSGPQPDSYESVDLSFTFSAVEPSFGWYEPLTEPVRVRALSAAARLPASVFVATVTPETVTLDKWFAKLAEPTRTRRTPPSETAFVATVAAATPGSGDVLYAASNSSVLFQRSIQYPGKVEPVNFTASAETTTPDKWLRPLSEPTRTRRAGPDQLAFVATVLSERWFRPLNEPARLPRALPVYDQQSAVIDPAALTRPETVSLDKWLRPLSDPPKGRPVLASQQPAAEFVAIVAAATPGSGDVLFSTATSSALFQYSFQYQAKAEPVGFADAVVPPVVIVPPPTDGGGVGRIARGGPSTFRWPAVKKKKKTYHEELEELEAFLKAVADSTPKIAEIERPPTVYRGPLAAAFFEQPRFEPKAAPKPVAIAAKPIVPPVEELPNDDEEAALLLINHEQELLLDLLRSLL